MLQSTTTVPTTQSLLYRKTYQEVVTALDELPPEALWTLRDFVAFLHTQYRHKPAIANSEKTTLSELKMIFSPTDLSATNLSPTIDVSIAQVQQLIGLLPELEGDALADSEAIYD